MSWWFRSFDAVQVTHGLLYTICHSNACVWAWLSSDVGYLLENSGY